MLRKEYERGGFFLSLMNHKCEFHGLLNLHDPS